MDGAFASSADNGSTEAGSSNIQPHSGGTVAPDASTGAGTSDGAAAEASSSSGNGGAPIADASLPVTPAADAGLRTDGASANGAAGDGGSHPYKGVANSACADLAALAVAWYYNWTLSPGNCKASQFVPMIWGHAGKEQTAAGITSEISGIVTAGYTTVLGFNEPDNATQSNIAVATAISLWPAFNNPSLRIGSPATQANTAGLAWLKNGLPPAQPSSFMSQINADTTGSHRVDFIAAHWYGWNAGSCDAAATTLEAYIKEIETIPGNRPIWLTEFGCLNASNPTAALVQAFFSGAVAMFARHPRVERYAWYPWTVNNELVGTGGALTALGAVFAAAPAYR